VVFVFATTEPQKIANTAAPVMSRLQRFDFRRIGPAAIHARLRQVVDAEGVEAEDDALLLIARHADGGMRDALSVLDQCLSFGEGPLTADRVRDVLGLVSDEAYGEILDLVAERQPGRVFDVVERLADAGADLVEVAGGLAELLRAVLMTHYQATPPVLSESSARLVTRVAAALAPEDAVRMLKLLGEAETPLRRSANPRLVLETMLLRWAMMDRAAELKALLQGGAPGPAGAPAPSTPPPPETIPDQHDGPRGPAYSVPWSEDGIRAAWPEIVETARRQSRFLGQALEQAVPRPGEPGTLHVEFGPEQAVSREGVERQKQAVEAIVSARLGTAVSIELGRLAEAAVGAVGAPSEARSGRLTVGDLRRDRLDQLRRRDRALDALVDALDLELIDDD
jgi:DNA polymerase-3 subunit gamma/tau